MQPTDTIPALVEAIAAACCGWVPAPAPAELRPLVRSGWVEVWERAEGSFVTLSPWAAERLGLRLGPMGPKDVQAARALGIPAGREEPAYRWIPREKDEPPHRQERSRPCVTMPSRLDYVAAADWRLQALIDRERRELALSTPGGILELLDLWTDDGAGRRPQVNGLLGGIGVEGRTRKPA